jgi:hypothetical protein
MLLRCYSPGSVYCRIYVYNPYVDMHGADQLQALTATPRMIQPDFMPRPINPILTADTVVQAAESKCSARCCELRACRLGFEVFVKFCKMLSNQLVSSGRTSHSCLLSAAKPARAAGNACKHQYTNLECRLYSNSKDHDCKRGSNMLVKKRPV